MKINCYIVQDLLPLYVEDLTNERTMSDVREHLLECEVCRELLEDLTKEQIVNQQEESVNVNELDYLRKIHRNITRRSIISAVLLSLIMLFAVTQFLWGNFFTFKMWVLLPLLCGLSYFTMFDGMKKENQVGFDFWIANVITVAITVCTIVFTLWIDTWLIDWKFPFGLQAKQVGPWINNVLWIVRIVFAGGVIYGIVKVFKKSILYFILISNGISGICMVGSYVNMLRQLDDVALYKVSLYSSIMLYVEGVIITVIIWIWLKKQHCYGAN